MIQAAIEAPTSAAAGEALAIKSKSKKDVVAFHDDKKRNHSALRDGWTWDMFTMLDPWHLDDNGSLVYHASLPNREPCDRYGTIKVGRCVGNVYCGPWGLASSPLK